MVVLEQQQISVIRAFRHRMRLAGCWGACFEVSCFIQHTFGWVRVDGVYALPDGRPIFLHSWNALSDGSLLDGTADQFGEGDDVGIYPRNSPSFLRYREKYTIAHNPENTAWLKGQPYVGLPDRDFWDAAEARKELPPGWWLAHPQQYLSWFRNGAAHYPMFATMREAYHRRGYDITHLV
ncbi:MAG: hypothetical protein H2043_09125 [Rhizobiales bacterium]|nr:hypothetical protein [Hyphomicrobiales bacterium]